MISTHRISNFEPVTPLKSLRSNYCGECTNYCWHWLKKLIVIIIVIIIMSIIIKPYPKPIIIIIIIILFGSSYFILVREAKVDSTEIIHFLWSHFSPWLMIIVGLSQTRYITCQTFFKACVCVKE